MSDRALFVFHYINNFKYLKDIEARISSFDDKGKEIGIRSTLRMGDNETLGEFKDRIKFAIERDLSDCE